MWSILLLGFLALKGADCGLSEDADHASYMKQMRKTPPCDAVAVVQEGCAYELRKVYLGNIFNVENLDESCRELLKYADCIDDTLTLCSDLKRAVIIAKSQAGVFRDLCDKDSNLRKVHIQNSPCLDGLENYFQYEQKCSQGGGILYKAYTEASRIKVPVGSWLVFGDSWRKSPFGDYDKRPCFQMAYKIACMRATAERVCGTDAGVLIAELAKRRSRGMDTRCTEKYREEIKNEFYDFLKEKQDGLGEDDSDEVSLIIARDEPKSPSMEKAIMGL